MSLPGAWDLRTLPSVFGLKPPLGYWAGVTTDL